MSNEITEVLKKDERKICRAKDPKVILESPHSIKKCMNAVLLNHLGIFVNVVLRATLCQRKKRKQLSSICIKQCSMN